MIWLMSILLVLGLFLLFVSSNYFVDGAIACSKIIRLSPLVIGMLVIGFATSAPEVVVSTIAAWQENSGIALGNAYGSNIANIALILGLTALMAPVLFKTAILKKELPILMGATLITVVILWDGYLSRSEGVILLLLFFFFIVSVLFEIHFSKKKLKENLNFIDQTKDINSLSGIKAIVYLVGGFFFLILSSQVIVYSGTFIAKYFGLSDFYIGLTIIALGTSLPELSSSLVAVKKGEHEMVIGNIIGSNLFNTLLVVGIAGLIYPTSIQAEVVFRDVFFMCVLTALLFVFGFSVKGSGKISRRQGFFLLCLFVLYIIGLALTI